MRRWSTEKVKKYLESFGCELLSEYKTERKNIKIKCKCGKIFENKLSNIKYNQYCMCNECYLIYKSEKSFNDFIKELEEIGYIYISNREEYKNSKSLVYVKCDKGHIIKISKNKIHSKYRCTKCNKENPKPRKIRKDYNIIKTGIELYDYKLLTNEEDYKGTKSEIQIECNKGHIYQTCYNVFQQGHRCPICKNSKGEEKIKKILENHKIIFIEEKTFKDCKFKYGLPFDFYLPQYNCCIEYDGLQHFEPVDFAGNGKEWANNRFVDCVIRDTIKNEYCKYHNIKLIRIPYWEFDNIEEILELELK